MADMDPLCLGLAQDPVYYPASGMMMLEISGFQC